MRKLPPGASTRTPVRRRWFLGLDDRQTAHSHPIIGTPILVPVPSNVRDREDMGTVRSAMVAGRVKDRLLRPGSTMLEGHSGVDVISRLK